MRSADHSGLDHAGTIAGRPGGPAYPSAPYLSFSAAQTALQGLLAALYVRERTGRGQRIDTSFVQAMSAHDPWDWFLQLVAERYPDAFQNVPPVSPRGIPAMSFAFRLLIALSLAKASANTRKLNFNGRHQAEYRAP